MSRIVDRLIKLYNELPIEYCGYALSAIEDVEGMLNQKPVAWIRKTDLDRIEQCKPSNLIDHPDCEPGQRLTKVILSTSEHSYYGEVPLYTTPKCLPLTDDEIVWLVPGLIDSLNDPYEQIPNDTFSSIKIDMIKLARAVERKHGILDNESEVCYTEPVLKALNIARDWINRTPHGDNCYVSDNYEGDPGNNCFCGKDSIIDYIDNIITQATGE